MYEKFYGFKEKPFNIAPDPDYLFLSRKHRNAISSLEYGLMDESGFILFTGEIGTGKTTILHYMLKKMPEDFNVAVVFNTNVNAEQLLNIILQEFGLNVRKDDKAGAIKDLKGYLRKVRSDNRRPLLIVDEAQSLAFEALEEIRQLSNLLDGNKSLLQIMLVGQPELNAKLSAPSMTSLNQRIAVNYHLQPFNREETGQYVAHRLKKAGGPKGIFSEAAIDIIHRTTGGTPRSINIMCNAALVYGFADDLPTIDVPVLEELLADNADTGIGINRWFQESTGGQADTASKKPTTATPSAPMVASETELLIRQRQLEMRLENLEARLTDYAGELRDDFKEMLIKERRRSDKLLAAFTTLKTKYEALTKSSTASDSTASHLSNSAEGLKSMQGPKSISLFGEPKSKSGTEK